MSILVTGGAGYIGSATVELLRQSGRDVVVLDNLVYGHREALAPEVPFYQGDIGDSALISKIAREHSVSACIHFAAYAYVGESVQKPLLYYRNNLASGLGLLEGLLEAKVSNIVFSSTCATYGEPQRIPIDETHPQSPINPYGASKWMFERVLKDTGAATDLKFVALRYFNASGAADSIGYANPRLPKDFGGNVQLAIDYVLAFMYPDYKGTVPTKADLPTTANQNDYYVVTDDGDGKSAGYVYT
ncbi:MAG: UDP-glucose 4-epimerase, partial [Cytophagaceae bacterium]